MAYLALARKYRPQSYEEVVGQELTTQTLKNALSLKKLHHAYLFTGPRGIGKTTIARLFAKSLNCQNGPTPTPCNQCSSCQEIMEGRSMDVLEIDGASNTSVDDVRELRDGIQYMASGGKYKVYIIDEVHMLSNAAFNALLKTLEEPPPHVIFIFATTEAGKLPLTILSRLLRFDFRRHRSEEIKTQLEKICQKEAIQIDAAALMKMAREATGSMRDALSLLDQAIASVNGELITGAFIEKLLGLTSQTQVNGLMEALLKKEATQALSILDTLFAAGDDLRRLSLTLMQGFHDLLLFKTTSDFSLLTDKSDDEKEMIQKLACLGASADFERLFELSLRNYQELQRTPLPKAHFEVFLIRMSQSLPVESLDRILEKLERMETSTPKTPEKKTPPPVLQAKVSSETEIRAENQAPTGTWEDFVKFVSRTKPQISSMLGQGTLLLFAWPTVELGFTKNSVYAEFFKDAERKTQLGLLAKQFFTQELHFRFKDLEPLAAPAPTDWKKEPLVAEAMSIFPGSAAMVVPVQSGSKNNL